MKLIENGPIITLNQDQIITDGGVVIAGKLIKDIGKSQELKEKYGSEITEVIDASGKIVLPGMINTHMHLYSTFARGMALEGDPPQNFIEILEKLWWKLDKALDLEDVYYSALLASIEAIKNGTTTIFDHHASPNAIAGSLDMIAKAVNEVGIRANLAYEVSDRDGREVREAGILENERFIRLCKQQQHELLTASFGLHASFTLENETLEKVSRLTKELDTGVHIHLAEGLADQEDSIKKYDLRVVERLAEYGLCNDKMLAAHGVHLSPKEVEILAKSNASLIHNPESNMSNAVGYTPIVEMLKKGLTVGLGTDGYTTDNFESIKVANLFHKHQLQNPSIAGVEVPQMVFENNRQIAAKYLKYPVGSLKEGSYADLIIVDYQPTTPITEENYYYHLLFGISGGMVELTMVNGQIVMQDREIVGVDLQKVYEEGRSRAQRLWSRL